MRFVTLTAATALAVLAAPAVAAAPADDAKAEKPITRKDPDAVDVVTTPATDLNIRKQDIPALLTAAEQRPYTLHGLSSCRQIASAIGDLDAVLGDDLDMPQSADRRMSPGRVAQSVVGHFIPFRGIIREISGANEHDRQLRSAVLAGFARRSFLKGIGQGKGCHYPARSATLEVYNQRKAELEAAEAAKAKARSDDAGGK
jgi:hypothetical protein